jgi:hypothetical protein
LASSCAAPRPAQPAPITTTFFFCRPTHARTHGGTAFQHPHCHPQHHADSTQPSSPLTAPRQPNAKLQPAEPPPTRGPSNPRAAPCRPRPRHPRLLTRGKAASRSLPHHHVPTSSISRRALRSPPLLPHSSRPGATGSSAAGARWMIRLQHHSTHPLCSPRADRDSPLAWRVLGVRGSAPGGTNAVADEASSRAAAEAGMARIPALPAVVGCGLPGERRRW